MKNNTKSRKEIIKRRRKIASIYALISNSIGIPMALIGTGGDLGMFHPKPYYIGMLLCLTGLTLFYILQETHNETLKTINMMKEN